MAREAGGLRFAVTMAAMVLGLITANGVAQESAHGCASIGAVRVSGVVLKTLEVRTQAAGPWTAGGGGSAVDLPEHCVWRAEIDPRVGADGKQYAIGFELRMPSQWNGGFYFQGGGGTDGLVRPAVGVMPNGSSTAKLALARGYAVASTDAGHEGQDASFGADQQARIDYYYNAVEQVTRVAREALHHVYGSEVKRSYFLGCSNGGRQALLAAQRLPLLFDGVVAGDPAFDLTRAAMAELWDDRTFLQVAPKDAQGAPVLSRSFSRGDLVLLSESVLAKCDALDGLKDGMIDDSRACHYDPEVLVCAGEKTESCLTRAQVAALQRAFAGPTTSTGQALYSDWPYDAGLGTAGWRGWKLGTSQTGKSNALNMTLGIEATKSIHLDVYNAAFDLNGFDFDTAVERSKNASALEDATSTAMSTFEAHGGKLMLFTGMSDPVFSANDLIRYYERLEQDNGGEERTQPWAKLYLIAGMNHCSGGPALDDFDPLGALEAWVGTGTMPARLAASGKSFPGRTRPMCAYPEYARYVGTGSIDDAKNFVCRRDASQ